MLTRISKLMLVVAAIALVFSSDLVVWQILPKRFDVAEMFAFWSGVVLCLLAVLVAVVSLTGEGKTKLGVRLCAWGIAEFLAFGFVYLYGLFSA
jgi:hypothetical protein